jgi:hypothetical protein
MNIFSGIISSDFKQLFTDAISALLYDDSCTFACTLYYGITKYQDCNNCVYDPIGQKSSNRFQSGGSLPFPFGSICPMCDGRGKKGVEATENIKLMVIFDSKQFVNIGGVANPEGVIQVLTFSDRSDKLARAKEIRVTTDVSTSRYERISSPQPCGLGNSSFVECLFRSM